MIGKIVDTLGRHARAVITVLILIVAGNVLLQLYTHKTTALTAWKGGGFGMYTEPHAESRSVWITLKNNSKTAQIRLWPETEEFETWQKAAGLKGRAFLLGLQSDAERFRYFPRKKNAEALISKISRVRWPETLTQGVTPNDGHVFKQDEISLTVTETKLVFSKDEFERYAVFSYPQGGGQ